MSKLVHKDGFGVFLIRGLDPGSRVQFHRSPLRVARDLQDTKRLAEAVRLPSFDVLFQEKKFDCETAGQLIRAPSPA